MIVVYAAAVEIDGFGVPGSAEARPRGSSRPPAAALAVIGAVVLIAAVVAVMVSRNRQYHPVLNAAAASIESPTSIQVAAPTPRTLAPYEGLGTWLDAFDYSPAYNASLDMSSALDDMAAHGVRTIFVQSGRIESRSPDVLEDRWVLADLLLHAHQRNIAVVAWFLPMWDDEAADLQHLIAAAEFDVLGERFDGVAVDIEWNQDGLEPEERSRRLVTLSERLDAAGNGDPLGAIVMPPVLLEEINEQFWPDFPWVDIAPYYDVWLPMSYWSLRSNESGYGQGYQYNFENTERIRTNTGQPGARVHGIGGIGGTAGERDFSVSEVISAIGDLELFAQSLADTDSIGGSVYDWMTLDEASRQLLHNLFTSGVASNLPPAG